MHIPFRFVVITFSRLLKNKRILGLQALAISIILNREVLDLTTVKNCLSLYFTTVEFYFLGRIL